MAEYICFFHPRVKGASPEDACPVCGREFGFPQKNLPSEIGNFVIEGLIGRGFYSIVLRARPKDTHSKRRFALKITPSEVYAFPNPPTLSEDPRKNLGGYGDRRNPIEEFQLHDEVSAIPQIVEAFETGETTAEFGAEQIPVWWVSMALAEGDSIQSRLESRTPLSPSAIAQIASELLDLKVRLEGLGVHHNDLHAGNIAVAQLDRSRFRRDAIDESIDVQVFDLGSAARADKSTDRDRLDDMEQISRLIVSLLDLYESSADFPGTLTEARLAAQLRVVAQFYSRGDIPSRQSKFSDMIEAIREAYELAEHPEQLRRPRFRALDDFYNAQLLPPEFTRALMYDPGDEWAAALSSPGPQLVVGMRGCGKTMLLRSLEWRAQAVRSPNETTADVRARLENLGYLGLFVSCAYLLRGVRERVAGRAVEHLYLAYAREAIRAASACEAEGLGVVDYGALTRLVDRIRRTVQIPITAASPMTLLGVERALGAAILDDPVDTPNENFAPLEAFAGLTADIQALVDAWRDKTVIYLLDDLSRRFVSDEDIVDLLAKLCLKDDSFGFKISTESQTEFLRSPGGVPALQGRDYQLFNLGARVLSALSGTRGDSFLEAILLRRHAALPRSATLAAPRKVIGSVRAKDIAERIRATSSQQRATRHYSGLRALAAICVGDIGDVIQIYQKFVEAAKDGIVAPATQAEVLIDESNSRLLSLAPPQTKLYYQHATAFAQASYRKLMSDDAPHSDGSPREHGDVYVEVNSGDAEALDRVLQLVGNGIFAIVKTTQRSKRPGDPPHFQFKLRFRKILGLRFAIPLGNRDRFEISEHDALQWLQTPSADTLLGSGGEHGSAGWESFDDEPTEEEPAESGRADDRVDDVAYSEVAPPRGGGGAEPRRRSLAPDLLDLLRPELAPPAPGWTATAHEVPFTADTVDWATATVLAATGFEDRAAGAWENYGTRIGRPSAQAILLNYPDSTNSHPALIAARRNARSVSLVDVDPATDPTYAVGVAIEKATGPLIIDVSAMTKSMIFAATRAALVRHDEVWITHTRADSYEPNPAELDPVKHRLEAGEFPEGLDLLDTVTPGEGQSFEPILIGRPALESSSRSLLALFATLKHARTDAILRQIESDQVLMIQSVHSDGDKSVESILTSMIAKYAVGARDGRIHQIGAMDPQSTFDLLVRYYSTFVLDGAFQMQLALTGTKMQTVGAAMFSSVAAPTAIFYAVSKGRDIGRFTHGTGHTRLFQLRRRSQTRGGAA